MSTIKITAFEGRWVYVGYTTIEDGHYIIKEGANIRYWGTSRGLGQLYSGPTSSTKLDPEPGTLRIPVEKLTAGGERECNQKVWKKVLKDLEKEWK